MFWSKGRRHALTPSPLPKLETSLGRGNYPPKPQTSLRFGRRGWEGEVYYSPKPQTSLRFGREGGGNFLPKPQTSLGRWERKRFTTLPNPNPLLETGVGDSLRK